MSDHDSFDRLCALAAAGDLSSDEFLRLQEHLHECPLCRAAYRDFHTLLHQGLPTVAPEPRKRWDGGGYGLKKRFLKRARKEGIPIDLPHGPRAPLWRMILAPAAMAAGLLLAAFGGYSWRGYRTGGQALAQTGSHNGARELALLVGRVAELERQLSETRTSSPAAVPIPIEVVNLSHERELTDELARLRNDHENALAARSRLEQAAAAFSTQLEQLRGDSQTARTEADTLKRGLREAEATLARANQDLDPLRAARAVDARTIAEQRARLDDLVARVSEQTETMQRERELLAAGRDIRDLMGARNLRVVDVQDTGVTRKAHPIPGRIFYTQGKSLIFYAYDLENKGNVSKVAFQVWGKKEGRTQPARSLGIFYSDDSAQKRWVMKFENPDVLAQIDQVFVTVEPAGGSKQPTGKTFLAAAFLNDDPNHP